MSGAPFDVVTGAFGYSGKYIAQRLLAASHEVRTLTNSPDRSNPFAGKVKAHPFSFREPDKLVEALRGAAVLYNTYWVRFSYGGLSYAAAVENTLELFEAARRAGVRRVVHVSITNPSEDSPFGYFRGKARLERELITSGLSYAILRPAVLFGGGDILINNIAWCLRRFPVFPIFGDGQYRLRPMHVDDLAKLAVEQGQQAEDCVIDAVGPETFTYRGLVEHIGAIIGKKRPLVSVSARSGYILGKAIGRMLGDILLTRDEIDGLMAGLLCTDSPPVGTTKLTDWARANASSLGARYASELARRRSKTEAYDTL